MAIFGKHFAISENGSVLEIFGAEAIKNEQVMTIMLTDTEHGPLSEVDPDSGPLVVFKVIINTTRTQGKLDKIAVLEISSMAAAHLWLQGALTTENFDSATETDTTVNLKMTIEGVEIAVEISDARMVDHYFRFAQPDGETLSL